MSAYGGYNTFYRITGPVLRTLETDYLLPLGWGYDELIEPHHARFLLPGVRVQVLGELSWAPMNGVLSLQVVAGEALWVVNAEDDPKPRTIQLRNVGDSKNHQRMRLHPDYDFKSCDGKGLVRRWGPLVFWRWGPIRGVAVHPIECSIFAERPAPQAVHPLELAREYRMLDAYLAGGSDTTIPIMADELEEQGFDDVKVLACMRDPTTLASWEEHLADAKRTRERAEEDIEDSWHDYYDDRGGEDDE